MGPNGPKIKNCITGRAGPGKGTTGRAEKYSHFPISRLRSNMRMYVYGVLLVFYFVINKRNLLFTFEHRRSAHSELGWGGWPPVFLMKAKIH